MTQHNNESLLQMFLDKLNPGGKIVFYTGSYAWGTAEAIVQAFEAAGKIKKVDEYKSLLIYVKSV